MAWGHLKFLSIFTLVSLAVGAKLEQRGCAADNCLRAVRATAFPTRQGTADCSSYLRATVTPATSTFYNTITSTYTTTETDAQTLTNTVHKTFTSIVQTTHTVSVTVTSTYIRNFGAATIKKRQQTVQPSAIPAYASACSGVARYTSACNCIGVSATTITVAAPSTTITLSTTVTEFSTVSPTLDTTTLITTDQTVTSTQTVATSTQTVVGATETWTSFYIRVKAGSKAGQYIYGTTEPVSPGLDAYYQRYTSDVSQATKFIFNAITGEILTQVERNIFAGQALPQFDSEFVLLFTPATLAAFSDVHPLDCSLSGANLSCTLVQGTKFTITTSGFPQGPALSIGVASTASNFGEPIDLEVVAI
ncbi:hypothetical protein TWF694_007269 [Orbilia ellipsospora]|uniref:Uncharacterized protein n=1 Tax=Orbilia ellipsospora TaxID=2528407 RepID=A0AAV9XHR7_9PEZI